MNDILEVVNVPELYDRDFNRKLDKYLTTGTMTADDYETLTPGQRTVIQCVKRAFARLTKKV